MNSTARTFGLYAENLAARYLENKGFTILHQNFRYKRYEIDLIVQKEALIVFVEVKARKNDLFGYPETFVNNKKIKAIRRAAEHYLHIKKYNRPIRFDTIAIIGNQNEGVQLMHFEDSFY